MKQLKENFLRWVKEFKCLRQHKKDFKLKSVFFDEEKWTCPHCGLKWNRIDFVGWEVDKSGLW